VWYADDIVVLCKGNTERILEGMTTVLNDLGLTLNEEKTRVVDAWQESFTFLGFSIKMRKGLKTGHPYPLTVPSKKALKHVRSEIKQLNSERYSAIPTEEVIRRANAVARGWAGYFQYGNCTKALSALRNYLVYRIRVYLRRKHRCHSLGYTRYPNSYYFETLGVYEVPTKDPWPQGVKAAGRR
jgi:hypothetical protein